MQILHNSIVSQFPEETWAQRKPNQRKMSENLGFMLEF